MSWQDILFYQPRGKTSGIGKTVSLGYDNNNLCKGVASFSTPLETTEMLCNARELHSFLESKQDFSTWIKKRIKDYGFLENQDYILLHKKMERKNQ